MSIILGVDIGGTHITTALIDLETRRIITGSKHRKRVNSKDSSKKILNAWCAMINKTNGIYSRETKKIGIAMPGPFNYIDGICLIKDQDKFNSLFGENIKRRLADQLGIDPDDIKFTNDAVSFLQGEIFSGAAKNLDNVLCLTFGTGLGSANYINNIASDAELWNSPFKDGIAEDYLSTSWFIRRYKELTGINISGVKELMENSSPEMIKKIFTEFAQNLGLFLVPLIKRINYKAIVLGGNISNAHDLFLPVLLEVLKSNNAELSVLKSSLGEDAALIGAASIWNLVKFPD